MQLLPLLIAPLCFVDLLVVQAARVVFAVEGSSCLVSLVCSIVVFVRGVRASPLVGVNLLHGAVSVVTWTVVSLQLLYPGCGPPARPRRRGRQSPVAPPSTAATRVWWPLLALAALLQLWSTGVTRHTASSGSQPFEFELWLATCAQGCAWAVLVGPWKCACVAMCMHACGCSCVWVCRARHLHVKTRSLPR